MPSDFLAFSLGLGVVPSAPISPSSSETFGFGTATVCPASPINRETSQSLRPPGPCALIKSHRILTLVNLVPYNLWTKMFLRFWTNDQVCRAALCEFGRARSSGIFSEDAHCSSGTQGFSSLRLQISISPRRYRSCRGSVPPANLYIKLILSLLL